MQTIRNMILIVVVLGCLVVPQAIAAALNLPAGGAETLAESASQADHILYVDADSAAGSADGSSWANADTTLQDALATSGDEIWVEDENGIISNTEHITGSNVTGSGSDNTAILDGFTIKLIEAEKADQDVQIKPVLPESISEEDSKKKLEAIEAEKAGKESKEAAKESSVAAPAKSGVLINDGGWIGDGEWEWGKPSLTQTECNSGSTEGCWVVDLDGSYNALANDNLTSTLITIPGTAVAPISINWAQAWHIESSNYDHATASYRCNSGAWTEVWANSSSTVNEPWQAVPGGPFATTCSAGETIELQFHLDSDSSSQYGGYFVDDVVISDTNGVIYEENFEPPPAPAYNALDNYKEAPSDVEEGGSFDYMLVISNTGSLIGSSTLISDTLPAEVTQTAEATVEMSSGVNQTSFSASPGSPIGWQGSIAAGAGLTITIPVQANANASATIINTAVITDPALSAEVELMARTKICPAGTNLYVKHDATGSESGTDWANAYTSLQDALFYADCDNINEIWVAEGVYYPDEGTGQTDNDRESTFQLISDVAIYGGFDGTESSREERDFSANMTVLSGDIDGDDTNKDENGIISSTEHITGSNAYHVVTGSGVTNTAILDGFTINAGNADGSNPHNSGGGIYNNGGSFTLTNLVISANISTSTAGGFFHKYSNNSLLTNITISANVSGYYGGGLYIVHSHSNVF